MDQYLVRPLKDNIDINVEVPGSKSITNRALLLAALGSGSCILRGVLFSADSRAFLGCLKELGFNLDIDEENHCVRIDGCQGQIPNNKASINVGSAGTAARFLTVFLAFAGGEYELNSSEQMMKRPMEPLITTLRQAGVEITCLGQEGHFPFRMVSKGITADYMESDTEVSSQFASAMLMSAPLLKNGLKIHLTGGRTNGAYIKITLRMMEQFGIKWSREKDDILVEAGTSFHIDEYFIEPDVSAAGYFYAMAPIAGRKSLVRGVHMDSMQGDIKFIYLLEKLGCSLVDTEEGILLTPPENGIYEGIDINMNDFSDQTMTMAAVAAFASSATTIHGISHIRVQESDRLMAIINELRKLGAEAEMIEDGDGLLIIPKSMHGAMIETYDDHRVAMAFALCGLRVSGVVITNPMCCRKTFENYFEVLDSLCI